MFNNSCPTMYSMGSFSFCQFIQETSHETDGALIKLACPAYNITKFWLFESTLGHRKICIADFRTLLQVLPVKCVHSRVVSWWHITETSNFIYSYDTIVVISHVCQKCAYLFVCSVCRSWIFIARGTDNAKCIIYILLSSITISCYWAIIHNSMGLIYPKL